MWSHLEAWTGIISEARIFCYVFWPHFSRHNRALCLFTTYSSSCTLGSARQTCYNGQCNLGIPSKFNAVWRRVGAGLVPGWSRVRAVLAPGSCRVGARLTTGWRRTKLFFRKFDAFDVGDDARLIWQLPTWCQFNLMHASLGFLSSDTNASLLTRLRV